jgi:hypothetical protein
MPKHAGVGGPLFFALVTHWLGSSLSFLWRSLMGGTVSQFFRNIFDIAKDVAEVDYPGRGEQFIQARDRILDWFFGAGPVIIDPFITLFSILFTSVLVYVGARLLVSPGPDEPREEISYESAVRIICYGMTPSILKGIPLFGGAIASICTLIVTVIGAREVYRTSTIRAILIALFPKLLFLGIILVGLVFLVLVFLKLFASVF